jgi:exopolyphosphatase/guanosine-5'-triphosphate,3'-diphosphate pyrophosphatase
MTGASVLLEPAAHQTRFVLTGLAPLTDRTVSFDLGYSSVIESYISADPPKPEELSAALSVIELHLDDVARELSAERSSDDGRSPFDMAVRDGSIIGLGPIFTNLAAIELGHAGQAVDGFELTREAAEDVFRTIATESSTDRLHNPGLDPDWVSLIVGGACLVVETFRCWGIEVITVSRSQVPTS